MGTYQKLHLADNLDALDLLANRDCDVRKFKFQQTCNALSKLYKESQLYVLDQEKTYILLVRYMHLFNHLKNTQSDKKFIDIRYSSEYDKVLMQYKLTKKNLEERYAAESIAIPVKPFIKEKKILVEVKPHVFYDEFITCQQLFSALQRKNNILLVDARSEDDFAESRIVQTNCINAPDHCITSGLSANALGKKLPPATQKIWEMRDSYDVIVLYDWNTSSDNFASTKLHKLHSALVQWDLNRNYEERPVILNGGYLELLQTYPTICQNPHVYLSQKNNELDELLELESIEYPSESDNKTLVMGVPEDTNISEIGGGDENEGLTKESLIEEYKEASFTRQEIITELQDKENERKKMNDMCHQENSIDNIANLKKKDLEISAEINQLNKILEDFDDKIYDDKKRLMINFGYDVDVEIKFNAIRDTLKIEDDSGKLKDIIDEERSRELKRARALKPKKEDTPIGKVIDEFRDTEIPVINRATKPTSHLHLQVEPLDTTSGLVGLRNIRNTCYMSTVIQCLRNIPPIMNLFCRIIDTKYEIRHPAAIIHETAGLVRQLWSKSVKSIDPYEFYNKVCQLEPTYKLGNHEDCMEFFLFLLNLLCEDCFYDVDLPRIMTPKQKAWYNQFEGKNSVFIDLFYHQIRITQNCHQCTQKTYKFEIESTFMLSVPEQDFNLDNLMNEYMADYIIPDYCCAKCKKPVNNQKEICYGPKIVVIVLKRYRQAMINGVLTLKKIESRAHFQKKNFRLGNFMYQLNAIALHSGDMNYGHYTAAASTPKGWYEFNDETVRSININDDSLKVKACAFFYSMRDDGDH